MIGGTQSNATWKYEKVYTEDFRYALLFAFSNMPYFVLRLI